MELNELVNTTNKGATMFNFVTLMIIIGGALNWFCIGVFQFDIIAGIFGTQSHFFSRFVYTVIGLAGFWILLVSLVKKGQLSLWKRKSKKQITTATQENIDNNQTESNIVDNNEQQTENTQMNDLQSKNRKQVKKEKTRNTKNDDNDNL